MRHALHYGVFLVLVVGGGWAMGTVAGPDAWYSALAKPAFTPPDRVFGPVWTVLYVMIAVAGARCFVLGPGRDFFLWVVQLVLNFAWTPIFFGLHAPQLALVVIAALLAAILAFIALRWRGDRIGAALFMPYAAWVAYAAGLNAAIVEMN
ncbi:MAG: tryptophan-rich sensory protein [Methyloligellaceae bacterium]